MHALTNEMIHIIRDISTKAKKRYTISFIIYILSMLIYGLVLGGAVGILLSSLFKSLNII